MENNNILNIIMLVLLGGFILKTCTNKNNRQKDNNYAIEQPSNKWSKSPVDKLIQKMDNELNFSIILADMDANGVESNNPKYKHSYKVLIEKPDTVLVNTTQWEDVSAQFFNKHVDNLGMEIVSKKDGVLHKQASPAGYNNYVGNPKYGQWEQRGGETFWSFYGKYAFMSSMFNLFAYPARRAYWNDYHDNYYRTSRPYYGPTGKTVYGTKSYTTNGAGKNTSWANKSSGFKNSVRSKVSRSSGSKASRSYSSSRSYSNSSNKTTRSSSRSSNNSSYRSRSGSYGK